ncbi:hypothetical protein SAMN05421805_111130 [Saccharopolyspora antimicrobica]|uniref:Uncharacterized protein n=1 Tax=Saccharopolyspora antimicrobica TaxID=455193 RepID=A0A1I5FL67_9PSEU|nr:hypothetical protein ATL45_0458 [Saccharopolyspora antimicrobica]SFO24484.1 hypothetical protein SAMN05421805_111130 [Saccharopolyspora antimicrobica]
MAGLMLDPAPEFRIPFPIGSVVCRVRVHATGRDTDIDGATMQPVKDYLFQIWESTTESPADVVRVSSGYGAALRRPHPGQGV